MIVASVVVIELANVIAHDRILALCRVRRHLHFYILLNFDHAILYPLIRTRSLLQCRKHTKQNTETLKPNMRFCKRTSEIVI